MMANMTRSIGAMAAAVAISMTSSCSDLDHELAPPLSEIRNAQISGIHDQAFTLTDGTWSGNPFDPDGASRPQAGLAEDIYLTGDLDSDGADEAAVVVWESSGGSGSYSYIAVFDWRDGDMENIGTSLIGDRVKISSAQIVGQWIVLTVLQHAPADPACCPTQKATRHWRMTDAGLQEREP